MSLLRQMVVHWCQTQRLMQGLCVIWKRKELVWSSPDDALLYLNARWWMHWCIYTHIHLRNNLYSVSPLTHGLPGQTCDARYGQLQRCHQPCWLDLALLMSFPKKTAPSVSDFWCVSSLHWVLLISWRKRDKQIMNSSSAIWALTFLPSAVWVVCFGCHQSALLTRSCLLALISKEDGTFGFRFLVCE